MNIPTVIAALVEAQNKYNSAEYGNCFSETAIVFDEGGVHTGRDAIKQWFEKANEKYRTVMDPIKFNTTGSQWVLTARISGTFAGSPIVLNYTFEIHNGLIQTLKITD